MNTVHPLVFPPKLSPIRQRFTYHEFRPITLVKLERGILHRSLLYCLEKGYFSLIHYLLQSGATDPREHDSEGRTALMYCCFIDNDCWAENLAIILLEYGAKIGDQDQRGLNALHYAITTQRLSLVQHYIDSLDFNLNQAIDKNGNTCLHYAASTGNLEIIRLVLNVMKRYSIDLSIKNRFGLTAYDIACQTDNERCQNLLKNEIIHTEQSSTIAPLPVKTNLPPINCEPLTDRRLSITSRIHSTTSSRPRAFTPATYGATSTGTAPLSFASAKPTRKLTSMSSFHSGSSAGHSSMLIDPIESHHIKLRRNESLDLSLLNQAKTLSNLSLSSSTNQNNGLNASSSTWRNDFSKIFDRFQIIKTPSYRETIQPPLSNELPSDIGQNLYSGGDGYRYAAGSNPSSLSTAADDSQKRRRSGLLSAKVVQRLRK
ncbi:unnamed protein product [Adineta steineri]|uniref:Uncharacterized protein n=1 Tax=Adineta steineri TaxID=433720 RepID=A0A814LLG9_9BILA|nr:unnamed protein product [Adineta steineri]CAF1449136.1 unnamed protein product [Adineta steineri]